jgi:hypothetical protein
MSFESLDTTFSPLKIEFPKVSKSHIESQLESRVLSGDAASLKALLQSTQDACENAAQAAYQTALQAMRLQAHEYIIRMLEQAILARQRMFGASSEQLSAQSRLFDEAETLALLSTDAQDTAPIPAEVLAPSPELGTNKPAAKSVVKPARGKRAPLPAELERVDVVHDVPQAERTCPCGTAMVEIGQDISEQLDILPTATCACCVTSASAMAAQMAPVRPSLRHCHPSLCPRATPAPTSWRCCWRSSSSMVCHWRVSSMF